MASANPDVLAGLHDVVSPPLVSYAPQTVGWAVVAGALVVLLAWLGWRAWERARANRYRKVALAEIDRIETGLGAGGDEARALGELNLVLKRTALTAWPRPEVARLAGEGWLAFLDETTASEDFGRGPGHLLADRLYAPPGPEGRNGDANGGLPAVFGLARRWVRQHRPPGSGEQAGSPRRRENEGRSPGEVGP